MFWIFVKVSGPMNKFYAITELQSGIMYIHIDNLKYKVTAIFSTSDGKANVDASNAYMGSDAGKGQGVIFSTKDNSLVVLADVNDNGVCRGKKKAKLRR